MAKIFRNNDIIANPVISDEKIYIISHSGTLASYDLNNLKLIWSVQIGGGNVPIVSGNSLFLIDNRNILYAMNAINGKIKLMKQLDTNIEEGFYFKDIKKIHFKGPFLIDNKLTLFSNNGYLIIGTFSEQGPLKCSGLEVSRYSESLIKTTFIESFTLLNSFKIDHSTPFNTTQNFLFSVLKKINV